MALRTRAGFRFSDIDIDARSPVPKYRQVYAAISEAILEGRLRPHDPLPSTRELADALGISRNSVVSAYDLLGAEGFVTGRGGAGTFVAQNAVRPKPPSKPAVRAPRHLSKNADALLLSFAPWLNALDRAFQPLSPAFDAFPFERWSKIVARLAGKADTWWADRDPMGQLALREQIAQHLRTYRSCHVDPGQVLIVSGGQFGMFLCLMLLVESDVPIWLEEPGYPNARLTFGLHTQQIAAVPVDEHGIDVEAGKALAPRPRLIFVTPAHQFPLGYVMSVQRRLALLDFAAECGAWIVEDDYDSDLCFDGRPSTALFSSDEAHRVIQIGTFSKSMHPGLRIGYMLLPPDLVKPFAEGRQIADRYPNSIAQAAMAEFMARGFYAQHLQKMRRLYAERHAQLCESLSAFGSVLQCLPCVSGTFTVAEFAAGLDDVPLTKVFRDRGFDSFPLSLTYAQKPLKHGALLGHSLATPERVKEGTTILEHLLRRERTKLR